MREALLRERACGSQSFVVCPRIEDLDGIAARLAEAAPELSVVAAHGKLKPQVLEERVAGFAAGEGDVLLATNIIEAGLNIPRANTILITRPDRFGLSQLHQMRGRVGRSTRRSFAYLLTEPGQALSAATVRRLRTLEAQAQLGAGVAISMVDVDARGAGPAKVKDGQVILALGVADPVERWGRCWPGSGWVKRTAQLVAPPRLR